MSGDALHQFQGNASSQRDCDPCDAEAVEIPDRRPTEPVRSRRLQPLQSLFFGRRSDQLHRRTVLDFVEICRHRSLAELRPGHDRINLGKGFQTFAK
jgi:hypothetical protein